MPKAVSGFTKHDAASRALVPSSRTKQSRAFTMRWVAYIPPARAAITCPWSAWASSPVPASTTMPAPSFPTGMGRSSRPMRPSTAPSGSDRTSPFSDFETVDASAPARRSPRSLGLMGDASTATSTSSGPGFGTSNSSIPKWTVDSEVTVEISRFPLDMYINSFLNL